MNKNSKIKRMNPALVKKRLGKFEKSFKPYKDGVIVKYGKDFADVMMKKAHDEYEKIIPEVPVFRGRLNIFNTVMGVNAIIVSFHRAMRACGKSVEESGTILFKVAEREHEAIPKPVRWVARKMMFSPLFLSFTRSSAKKVYDHPEGWKIDYQKGDGKQSDWNFECSECGVIKYFKKQGVEELGQYCNYVDFIQSRTFGLGLLNPKNLGLGDELCIETFKQGRKTELPDNLKIIAEK